MDDQAAPDDAGGPGRDGNDVELGVELESVTPGDARNAYMKALSIDPHHTDALVNLGRLIHEDGDPATPASLTLMAGPIDCRISPTEVNKLEKRVTFLATTASITPFIGLFGTVWGIYHALMSIGSAGQATIDKVAGPIGEALIMTALGLAVAIPAVLGYNALVRGNKFVLTKLNSFAHDLHAYFVTGARVQATDATIVPLKKV